jgi:hypothetical protein
MSRRQPAEEGLLFDLPLDRTPADARVAEDAEQPALPLAEEQVPQPPEEPAFDSRDDEPLPVDAPPAGARRPTTPPAGVTLRQRAAAGVADLGACAAVMVVLLVALLAQGVRPALSDWPAGALFLLTFSFLYAVLPLAAADVSPGGPQVAGIGVDGRVDRAAAAAGAGRTLAERPDQRLDDTASESPALRRRRRRRS